MLIPSTPGVYCLWNKITNQIYVGSAKDLNKRIDQHFSSRCQNSGLKKSIQEHGEENFSTTWLETGSDFMKIEQSLIDFAFTLEPHLRFNIARKAGGNPGGTIEGQRALSEAGGSPKRVPLFLIDTGTGFITRIDSSYEGERLGFGPQDSLSHRSKLNCLNRVKTCLVARSESEAKSKLEAWLKIPGNTTIDNPIILTLGKSEPQFALYKLTNVCPSHFSKMYREVINPSSGKPLILAMKSKSDFVWHETEVKAGDWFRCTKTSS